MPQQYYTGINMHGNTIEDAVFDPPVSAPRVLGFSALGNGAALQAGLQRSVIVPFDCTIVGWAMVASPVGSITIDVRKSDDELPTEDDSIVGELPPTLDGQTHDQSTTLTGWTITVTENDMVTFVITESTTIEQCTLVLTVVLT